MSFFPLTVNSNFTGKSWWSSFLRHVSFSSMDKLLTTRRSAYYCQPIGIPQRLVKSFVDMSRRTRVPLFNLKRQEYEVTLLWRRVQMSQSDLHPSEYPNRPGQMMVRRSWTRVQDHREWRIQEKAGVQTRKRRRGMGQSRRGRSQTHVSPNIWMLYSQHCPSHLNLRDGFWRIAVIQPPLMGITQASVSWVRLHPRPLPISCRTYYYSNPGRRVLESYLLLMLTSSRALKPTHDMDIIVQRTLNSYVVGQHVGSKWGIGRKLRWTPTVAKDKLRPGHDQTQLLRSVGLYKIQGDAVSAIMGGIFHQFVRLFLAYPIFISHFVS